MRISTIKCCHIIMMANPHYLHFLNIQFIFDFIRSHPWKIHFLIIQPHQNVRCCAFITEVLPSDALTGCTMKLLPYFLPEKICFPISY